MKIGLLRETKIPIDKRVPLTPNQCMEIMNRYPQLEIVVQSSKIRTILDAEYKAAGIKVVEDVSDCDILMGVKEVHPAEILDGKIYFIFSHTIKKQSYNRRLLREFAAKRTTLIDYECIKDAGGNRVVAFGHFAGIVGTYHTLRAYGLKYGLFELPQAYLCETLSGLKAALTRIQLPPLTILLTGSGRVASGALEILDFMQIQKITESEFFCQNFQKPVYLPLRSEQYYLPNDPRHNGIFFDFYTNPKAFRSDFFRYLQRADIFIAGAYWNPEAPPLFTWEQLAHMPHSLKVIGDITCDVNGSIPTTIKTSSIDHPYYDINPFSREEEVPFVNKNNITVMAIDNLPCELSRDASEDFGKQLLAHVIPHVVTKEALLYLEGAMILKDGTLTRPFSYLKEYISS